MSNLLVKVAPVTTTVFASAGGLYLILRWATANRRLQSLLRSYNEHAYQALRAELAEEERFALGTEPAESPDLTRRMDPGISVRHHTLSAQTPTLMEISNQLSLVTSTIQDIDRRNTRVNLITNLVFFVLGVATPIALKQFGIG